MPIHRAFGLAWSGMMQSVCFSSSGYPGYSCSVCQEGKHDYLTLSAFLGFLFQLNHIRGIGVEYINNSG